MPRIVTWLLALLFILPGNLYAETGDVPMAASNWSVLAGTGTLGNVDENVPGLGVVPVLSAQTTDSTKFAFIQAGYLGLNQTGRYVRAQMKSSAAFLIDVRVRADNGLDYHLSYSSYPRVAVLSGSELKLTLSAGYPARVGVYTTYTLDLQRDLARLVPGVNLAWVRWVSLRGAMSLGRLQILDAVTYLATDDDGDLLTGAAEDALGTNPFLFDTDGDGVADGLEAGHPCGNPLDAAVPSNLDGDPDGDGVPTRTEMFLGSNCAVTSNPVLPTAYGWEPYYPSTSLPPGASVTTGGGGELIINHAQSSATGFGVLSAPVNGRLRLPNKLQVAREVIRFEAKSAELFNVTVHVKASNGLEYDLAFISSTGAASFIGGTAYYRLASLGYAFGATAYTAVERNLSADLGAFVPGATVSKVLWVGVRGRLSIKNIGFDDVAAPVVINVYEWPDPVGLGLTTTIRFKVNERLVSSPTVTVAGRVATLVWNNGVHYEYDYTNDGSEGNGPAAVSVQATDLAGHTGTGTGSVLFDFVLPTFVGPLNVSPLLANAWQAMTVQFTASKPITTAVVTVDGRGASPIAVTGDTYTYGYVVDGTETEGAATVNVLMVDAAGNTASQSRPVTFDFTDPTFSSIVVSKSPAKVGDILAVTFDTSELLAANPTVTVGGGTAFFLALTGSTYTYSYLVTGTEIGGPLTPISVGGDDAAGNTGSGVAYMVLDFDPPTFTNLAPAFPIGTTWTTVTFSVDESEILVGAPTATVGLLGTAVYLGKVGSVHTFSFTLWGGEPEGGHLISVSGVDAAGNLGSSDVGTLVVDYHPPIINPAAVNPLMAKSGDTVTITFALGETVPALPQVAVDGLAATLVTQVGNSFTYTYTLTGAEGNGILPVRIRAWDVAGNRGERFLGLLIDAAPLVSLTSPGDGASGVTVTTLIRAQFNEAISASTVNAASFLVSGGAAVGTVTYDAATRIAQFQLTGGNTLDYDTTYTVTLTTAITDVGGNPLAASYVFTFHTVALGMASIAGTLTVPPTWVLPKVIEVTGNHLGTIAGGAYQINVDRRTNNFVYAWDDVNGDGAWQGGLEQRLIAYACGTWPGSQIWDTSTVNVSNANIGFKKLAGTYVAPGTWNVGIYESETGNLAALLAGGKYEVYVDRAEDRHLYIFNDTNLDGLRQPAENAIRHAYDPVGTCFGGFMPPYNFGIRSISGRVTEPTAPFLDLVASSDNIDGPYSYGAPQGPTRDYTVYADVGYYSAYVWAFDDANTDGMMDPGEVRIPVSAAPVNLTVGDVDGAYIFRRQISGTVAPAPGGWARPRVTQTPDGYAKDVPLAGGAYAIWVPARPNLDLFWFNDANNNYKLDAGESSLRYPVKLNTIYGDLTGIDFTGVCGISGSFTPPASWSAGYVFARAEAVTYATAFTGQVASNFYVVGVQPAAAQIRLLAYEDTNRDGVFDANSDRHVGFETNDFSNVGACALTKNFVVTRTVSGAVSVPPGWVAPTVRVTSGATLDPAMNTATVTAGAYNTLRVAASIYVYATLFDDRNGNRKLDDPEPALSYPSTLNTSLANQTADFPGRTISGTAGVPIDAVNPKVSTNKVWAPVSAGSYLLNVNNNSFSVTLWDDLDNDNVVDWNGEPVYGYGFTNATAGNVILNFNLHTIQGRVSPPPTWSGVLIDVDNAQTYGVGVDGKYVAYVVDGWHSVRMFDDVNGNGRYDWSEPSVSYPNGVQVAGADVLGVNIDYPTISGSVQVPPNFINPLVGVLFGGDGVVPVAPVAGAFSLPAYYGWMNLGVFDDTNGTGAWEWGEPVIRLQGGINVTGDLSGVQIEYRTVRGSTAFPPSWTRPGIYAQGGMGPLNGVVNAGTYEVYVEPSTFIQVGMYDDLALQFRYTWPDPAINWPTSIDTTFGDVNNIDLYYRTIAGSVTAGTTAGWLRPRTQAGGSGTPVLGLLAGLDFALYVSPWEGPYGVGVFDDFDLSGAKNAYEPGRVYHVGLPCALAPVDVSLGDVTGLIIDSACPY